MFRESLGKSVVLDGSAVTLAGRYGACRGDERDRR